MGWSRCSKVLDLGFSWNSPRRPLAGIPHRARSSSQEIDFLAGALIISPQPNDVDTSRSPRSAIVPAVPGQRPDPGFVDLIRDATHPATLQVEDFQCDDCLL